MIWEAYATGFVLTMVLFIGGGALVLLYQNRLRVFQAIRRQIARRRYRRYGK